MTRVLVLGGGIAGLTAAFRRTTTGETILLEAGPRLGGSIRTIREDGFTLEAGPSTLRTNEAAERLVADTGLAEDVVVADGKAPRWIVRGGRARAIVPGPGALFTSLLSAAGKLRLLREPWVRRRPDSLDDESVHSFFARRFGEEAALFGAGPIVSGIYAGDARTLSMRSGFPRLWEAEAARGGILLQGLRSQPGGRPRTVSFRAGLFSLVEALEKQLDARPWVRLETNAAAIAVEGPRADSTPGRRWTVRTADGRAFDADVVVSTLSAAATARLFAAVLTRSGRALASLASSSVAVVAAAYGSPKSAKDAPRGFGALFPRGESFRSLGILFSSSMFGGRAPDGTLVTTCLLGGALDHAAVGAPDADLLASSGVDVARLFARLGPSLRSWIVRWPDAIPQPPVGHHRALTALSEDLAALEADAPGALHVTSGFRDGIALADRIARGEAIGQAL